MKRVQRATAILEKIANSTGLSEDGKRWLIAVTDPMHDEMLQVTGYPDRDFGSSICQVVKQSLKVAKPPGMDPGAWNLSVVMDDDAIQSLRYLGTTYGNLVSANAGIAANPILPAGGLTTVATTTGAYHYVYPLTPTISQPGPVADIGLDGISRFRVLGQAFEVVNTTPELYRGGSIAVWEQNTSLAQSCTYQVSSVDPSGVPLSYDGSLVADGVPPETLQEALLLCGTQQWAAAEGCYCVATMNSLENPPKYCDTNGKIFYTKEADSPVSFLKQALAFVNVGNTNATFSPKSTNRMHFLSPYNRKGAYLSGLSEQSTFTINYNVIIETFPNQTNKQLCVLATPSAAYDPAALALYSAIVSRMPVGVRFADNGLGDWFLGIVDSIAEAVSSIGKPILGAVSGYQAVRDTQRNAPAASTWSTEGKTGNQKVTAPPPPPPPPQKISLPRSNGVKVGTMARIKRQTKRK